MRSETAPTIERTKHGVIERDEMQIVDSAGNAGWPFRALSLMERWESDKDITKEMRLAGENFQRLFHAASLDPLRAADMSRTGGGRPAAHHSGSDSAQRAVRKAMDALGGMGSPAGSGVWLVFGCEHSIRQWAAREQWKDRPLNREVAKRVLIDALTVLVSHFGY